MFNALKCLVVLTMPTPFFIKALLGTSVAKLVPAIDTMIALASHSCFQSVYVHCVCPFQINHK